MAARGDPEGYGELRVLTMPPTRTVFGPEQIHSRINTDEAVSAQITLWNQSGSRVVFGNLIVLPIADSLLYAQPLFLQNEDVEIPELQRVVVVFGERVEMGNRLSDTLETIFGAAADDVLPEESPAPGETEPDGPLPDGTPADPEVQALVTEALDHFTAAEEALMDGDLVTYAEETAAAQAAIEDLNALLESETGPR